MKTTTEQPSCKWNLQRLILIHTSLLSLLSFGQPNAENAPVVAHGFSGQFAIDGFQGGTFYLH